MDPRMNDPTATLPYSRIQAAVIFSGTQLIPLCFLHRMVGCVQNVPLSTRKQAKSVNNVRKKEQKGVGKKILMARW